MDFPYALGQPLLVRSPYQLPKGFDSWRGNCENPFLEILHQLYTLEVFSKLLSLNSEKVLISSLCGRDMACISLHVFSFFIVHVINSCYALSAPGPAFEELNFFFLFQCYCISPLENVSWNSKWRIQFAGFCWVLWYFPSSRTKASG